MNSRNPETIITHGTVRIGSLGHRVHVRSFPRTGLALTVHEAGQSRPTVNQIVLNVTPAELRELAAILTAAATAQEEAQS